MAKGGDYEREIAKILSLYWSEDSREDIFYRSQASGGRFTRRKQFGKDTAFQAGDMTFSDPIGAPLVNYFNIECKTGYGKKRSVKDDEGKLVKKVQMQWDLMDLIDSKQKEIPLITMWKQCEKDSWISGRFPLLIFRRNNRASCVVLENSMYNKLSFFFGPLIYKSVEFHIGETSDFRIITLESFLKWAHNLKHFIACQNHRVKLDRG